PSMSFIFFFQAEDGIRDFHVTGVQTWLFRSRVRETLSPSLRSWQSIQLARMTATELSGSLGDLATIASFAPVLAGALTRSLADRSEERRVGKARSIRKSRNNSKKMG